MQNPNPSNVWCMKRIKHNQKKYHKLQNKKNEIIIESLASIEKNIQKMQHTFSSSLKQSNENLSEKTEKLNQETIEAVQSLHEDINQTQELIKILVANQLIDQI